MVYRFRFFVHNDIYFMGQLECARCIAISKNGNECRRKVCIGMPYCWQHLLSVKHLKIKPSTEEDAGKGLFAINPQQRQNAIVFQTNAEICNYYGEFIDLDTLENRYGDYTAPYTIQVKKNERYEDAALHRGIGSLANHSLNNANVSFHIKRVAGRNHHVVLKALRPIRNGEEIFINYGNEYLFYEPTTNSTR